QIAPGELVLEAAPVELVRGKLRTEGRAVLRAPRDVAVVARGEEEAHTHLRELLALDVILEAEHPGEVVRADLERRLSHLERRFRRRPFALLGHEDRRFRPRLLELQRE